MRRWALTEDSREEGGPGAAAARNSDRRWTGRLPELLVLLSLLGVLVLPVLAQQRIDRLRDEINDLANPARANVAEIQLALALESAARRAYLFTRDEQFAASVRESHERRLTEVRELVQDADRLGEDVPAATARLIGRLREIDASVSAQPPQGRGAGAAARQLEQQRDPFAAALAAADSVDAAVERAADRRRDAIATTEQVVGLMTAALVLLALASALLVARLRRNAEDRRLELERVTESRTRLLRGFTHDVKNPLGAADGYFALLEEGILGPVEPRQVEAIGKGRRAIHHALDLIGSLLEIARAEAGQLTVHAQPADVGAIVLEITDAFQAQAQAKDLSLSAHVAPGLPTISTDVTRVGQIVGNLISNAIKYTPAGGHIAVSVGTAGMPRRRHVAVTVRDDGRGIPEDQMKRLFTEFTRFDPEAAEGAGIGLSISQKIAAALGGRIVAESRAGGGSTFTLRLPIATPRRQ